MNISIIIIIIIILIRSSSRSSTSVRGMGSKLRWNTMSTNGFDSGRRGTRTCELLKWAEVTGTGDWWRLGGAPCAGKWPSNATMLLFIIISIAPLTSTTPVNRCVKQRFHWLRRWWCWWWLSQVKKNGGASQKIPELSWFRFDLEVMQQANIKLWAKLSLKRNSKKHGVFECVYEFIVYDIYVFVCSHKLSIPPLAVASGPYSEPQQQCRRVDHWLTSWTPRQTAHAEHTQQQGSLYVKKLPRRSLLKTQSSSLSNSKTKSLTYSGYVLDNPL